MDVWLAHVALRRAYGFVGVMVVLRGLLLLTTKTGAGTTACAGTKAGAGTKAIPIPTPAHLASRQPRHRDQKKMVSPHP